MASLLMQQGKTSQQQQASSGEGEGKAEREKEQRDSSSLSSMEDSQGQPEEQASSERREKVSGVEGKEKQGTETGVAGPGKPAARSTTGAEGREHQHQHPPSAEMMHRQQLEYQRYR